jgi:hypothetical protein
MNKESEENIGEKNFHIDGIRPMLERMVQGTRKDLQCLKKD